MDDNWPAVVSNLSGERSVWKRMTRILSRQGAELRVSSFFFKAVVQAVLLFGSETWLVPPPHGQSPGGGGVQIPCGLRLTERLPMRKTDRKWEYTLVTMAREEDRFQTKEEYIWHHRTCPRITSL